MKRLILLALFAASAFAAGTVQQTITQLGTSGNWVLAFNWTGDASTGTVPTTPGIVGGCCQGYLVTTMETVPRTPNPTANYSVSITDGSGADQFAGLAGALSASLPQSFAAPASAAPVQGTLNLVITGQAVAGAKGAVYVFLSKPGQINAASLRALAAFTIANLLQPINNATVLGNASGVGAYPYATADPNVSGHYYGDGSYLRNTKYSTQGSNGGSPLTGDVAQGPFITTMIAGTAGNFWRFPGLTYLPNGNPVAAVWGGSGNETPDGSLDLMVSTTRGEHWAFAAGNPIFTPPTGFVPYDVELSPLSSGKIVASMDIQNTAGTVGRVYTQTGDANPDNTVTWGVALQVTDPSFSNWTTTSKTVSLANGSCILPVYGSNVLSGPWTPGVLRAPDCQTFGSFVATAASGTYSESGCLQIPVGYVNAGRIICINRGQAANGYARNYSDDNGATFHTNTVVIAATSGYLLGKPALIFLPSGAIVMVARWKTGVTEVFTSWDQGLNWTSYDLLVAGVAVNDNYDSMSLLSGGDIGLAFAHGGNGDISFTELVDGYTSLINGNQRIRQQYINGDMTIGPAGGNVLPVSDNTDFLSIRTAEGVQIAGFDATNKRLMIGPVADTPIVEVDVDGQIYSRATSKASYLLNSPGSDFGQVFVAGSDKWCLGFSASTATGTAGFCWAATGDTWTSGTTDDGYGLALKKQGSNGALLVQGISVWQSIPTSCSGKLTGTLWNNSGVASFCP